MGAHADPTTLLRRYRGGDLDALADLFDSTAPGLFRIALALAPDEATAEDALQDAWLALLEATAGETAIRDVPAWLAGVVRNRIARARRDGRRVLDPLRLEPRVVPEDPADRAEREEILLRLGVALDALPEPYREVAVLRWRYGLTPTGIADARGLPPGTVRSQLGRAAEKIRAALGRRASLLAGLAWPRGLEAVRGSVLEAGATGVITAGSAAALVGGVLVAKKILIATAAVLCLLAVWIGWSGRVQNPDEEPASRLAARPTPTDAVSDSREDPENEERPDRALEPAETRGGTGGVRVGVVWDEDGTPAVGIHVRVICWDGPDPLNRALRGVTGPDGSIEVEGVPVGHAGVYLHRGGSARVDVVDGRIVRRDLKVPAGITVSGVVVDATGRAVERADVWLSAHGNRTEGVVVATTAADGRFRLRSVGTGRFLCARAPGRIPSSILALHGQVGETKDVRLVLGGPGAAVAGEVRDGAGQPVAGARVRIWRGPTAGDAPVLVETGISGRFEAPGVPPGRLAVEARAIGHAPFRTDIEASAGDRAEIAIVLARGAVVRGSVTGVDGAPVAGARVLHGRYGEFSSSGAFTGPDGTYVLVDLPAGPVPLRAAHDEAGEAGTRVELVSGGEAQWDPALSRGHVLRGRLLAEDGGPLAAWSVSASLPQVVTPWQRTIRTGPDGRFEIPGCPAVVVRISVRAPQSSGYSVHPTLVRDDVLVGGGEVEIRVPDAEAPSAFLTGEVRGPDGEPVGGASVMIRHPSSPLVPILVTEQRTGRFRSGPLPAATYRVEIRVDDRPPVDLGETPLRAGETRDLGVVRLAESGRLAIRAIRDDGVPAKTVYGSIRPIEGGATTWIQAKNGVADSGSLAPGFHLVRMQIFTPEVSFVGEETEEVIAGETVQIEVRLRPAARRTFRFEVDGAVPARVHVRIRGAGGRLVVDSDFPGEVTVALLPGSYAFEAVGPDGRRAEGSVEVGEVREAAAPVVAPLR